MNGIACDRCAGALLGANEDVRYEVEITVKAAYDPMELNLDQIAKANVSDELERLRQVIASKSAEELENEVFKQLTFDLCMRCQRNYLQNPLGAPGDPK